MGVVWQLIIDQRLVHLTPHMVPCDKSHSWISGGDQFLVKIRRCLPSVLLKMVVHSIFNKNRCWVAFDRQPEARTPFPTYVSLPSITFLDFWWRPFLSEKSVGVSLQYY